MRSAIGFWSGRTHRRSGCVGTVMKKINELNGEIKECTKCPRLAAYIREVAKNKVRRFAGEYYYGRPLPGFGDIKARLLIVGLAPAAHGGNRTGRMFTGDSSGDWLARAMYGSGFASQPSSQTRDDGLILCNAYVTAAVRCAPPQNKPTGKEMENCFGFLERELDILKNVSVILCLGKIAYDSVCRLLETKPEKFGHNKVFTCRNYTVIASYHPSRQNTQTGRLSWRQWQAVFRKAQKLVK